LSSKNGPEQKEKFMNSGEVPSHSTRPRFSERLRASLTETLAYARGEADLPMTVLTLPDPPPSYDAERIRTLRTDLGFSQPYFSRLLNVSPKTVQSWEQGTRIPSHASARLLQLIENPSLLDGLRQQATQSHD
jgi:putative transcriptional regulator